MNPGIYWGQLTGATTIQSSEKKTPGVALKFNVTSFANGSAWENLPTPVERTMFLYCSSEAWQYTKDKLARLGFNGNFDQPMFAADATTKGVELEMTVEEYKGKQRERWDLPGSMQLEKAGSDVIRQLNAQWKATVKPSAPVGRPPSPPTQRATPPPSEPQAETVPPSGDVPFDPEAFNNRF